VKKTPEQLAVLEEAFRGNPNPPAEEAGALAVQLELTQAQVEQWFGYRRGKEKKALRAAGEEGDEGEDGAGPGSADRKRKAAGAAGGAMTEKRRKLEEGKLQKQLEGLRKKQEELGAKIAAAGEGAAEKERAALDEAGGKIREAEEKLAQLAEEARLEAEEKAARLKERELGKQMKELEKERAKAEREQERERAKAAREAAKKKTKEEKKRERDLERSQKELLKRIETKKLKMVGDGHLVEDGLLELEVSILPAIAQVAAQHGVDPVKLRENFRDYRLLGEETTVGLTIQFLNSNGTAAIHGTPIPQPSEEDMKVAVAVTQLMGLPVPPPQAFPPPVIQLGPAFEGDLPGCFSQVLEVHSIAHGFVDTLGLWPFSIGELLTAFREGQKSRLLAQIFISLLQLVQADMEVAQSALAMGNTAGQDKALQQNASMLLNEGWAWGLDNEAWRAHLNPLTWPEVLRQVATMCGWGARRKKSVRQIAAGFVAEEMEHPSIQGLTLKLPQEIGQGTVKYAVWHVLAQANAQGLKVEEILDRIKEQGLREIGGRTPKITVAGACREGLQQGIFFKVKPGVFALRDVVEHTRGKQPDTGGSGSKIKCGACHHCLNPSHKKACLNPTYINRREEEEKAEAEEQRLQDLRKEWVEKLLRVEYNELNMDERVQSCLDLMQLCLEMPTLRKELNDRIDADETHSKALAEVQRLERARRQNHAVLHQSMTLHLKSLQGQLDKNTYVPPAVPFPPELVAVLGHDGMFPEDAGSGDEGEAPGAPPKPLGPRALSPGLRDQLTNDLTLLASELPRMEQRNREEEASFAKREAALSKGLARPGVRLEPLGSDRRYNRYWKINRQTRRPALVVELAGGEDWRLLATLPQLDMLIAALSSEGQREAPLRAALVEARREMADEMEATVRERAAALERAGLAGVPADGSQPLDGAPREVVEAVGRLSLDSPATGDDALLAYLADKVECYAPLSGDDAALAEVLGTADASAAGDVHMAGDDDYCVDRVALKRVQDDLLAVGCSLPQSALFEEFERAKWIARTKAATSPKHLRERLGELEAGIKLSKVHEGMAVGPRLRLVFGAWLDFPGQFATMERSIEGWVGVPMEEVLVEDLEWTSDIGCSKCQFSSRGCRTCLFRIIETCYEKDTDIPPLVAELAERFHPWPEKPPPPEDMDDEERARREENDQRRKAEAEAEQQEKEANKPKPLAWLPATISAVAFRLYCLDANLIYGEGPGARPARDDIANYKYIMWPATPMPRATAGDQTSMLVGPFPSDPVPKACITDVEEAQLAAEEEARAREEAEQQKLEKERRAQEARERAERERAEAAQPKKITLKGFKGKEGEDDEEEDEEEEEPYVEDIFSDEEEPEEPEKVSEYEADTDEDFDEDDD